MALGQHVFPIQLGIPTGEDWTPSALLVPTHNIPEIQSFAKLFIFSDNTDRRASKTLRLLTSLARVPPDCKQIGNRRSGRISAVSRAAPLDIRMSLWRLRRLDQLVPRSPHRGRSVSRCRSSLYVTVNRTDPNGAPAPAVRDRSSERTRVTERGTRGIRVREFGG